MLQQKLKPSCAFACGANLALESSQRIISVHCASDVIPQASIQTRLTKRFTECMRPALPCNFREGVCEPLGGFRKFGDFFFWGGSYRETQCSNKGYQRTSRTLLLTQNPGMNRHFFSGDGCSGRILIFLGVLRDQNRPNRRVTTSHSDLCIRSSNPCFLNPGSAVLTMALIRIKKTAARLLASEAMALRQHDSSE